MDQKIIDLYDEYTHQHLDRRLFLNRLAELTGSMGAALALVPLLEANQARAATISPDDTRLHSERTAYKGETGEVKAYLSRPLDRSGLPAVVVIHENRGLNAHIEDVTRRLALEGLLSLAPDLLSPAGGTPADEDLAREQIGKLDMEKAVANGVAAIGFLEKHADGNGKVSAVGFCWGGGMVGSLAVASKDLDAGVVYYGRQPKTEDVKKIRAPLLLHYAELDTRINEGIPAFEEALKKAGKKYELIIHKGVNHAFNNDTSVARYNKEAAERAWARTVAFLQEHLKA